jgi:replicative DNA helicase
MSNNYKNKSQFTEFGKVPPQAIEFEEAILGACIIEKNAIITALKHITADCFYKDSNRYVFEAICNLNDEHSPIDLLTVVEKLRQVNQLDIVGGATYIAQLSNKVGSAAHLEFHCQTVYEKYCRREIIRVCSEVSNDMFGDDLDIMDAIALMNGQTINLLKQAEKDEKHIKDAVNEALKHSMKMNAKDPSLQGIKTGFTYFDNFSGGLQRGDLVIIGGEPSNGKTTLALNIIQNCANAGSKVAFYSYEMTINQIAARMIAYDKRISSKDIIRGEVPADALTKISNECTKLKSNDIWLVKPKGTSFGKLKTDIQRIKLEYDIDALGIDYIQLISNNRGGGNKAELTGEIANELKALAVELDIAIVLLSQLARDNNSPRPTISRLKYSGDIEAAADTIIMPYLPFKYGKMTENVNNESVDIGENAIIIVGKGRNIGTTEFILEFKKEVPAFYNHFEQQQPSLNNYTEPSYSSRLPVDADDVPF